jgi:hypothetical protein
MGNNVSLRTSSRRPPRRSGGTRRGRAHDPGRSTPESKLAHINKRARPKCCMSCTIHRRPPRFVGLSNIILDKRFEL